MMKVRAVLFDIGGVLEVVGPPTWADTWSARLGFTRAAFDVALRTADPDDLVVTGGLDESSLSAAYARVLGLSPAAASSLMEDVWDWYCGYLDEELVAYVRGLRPALRTGIVSNSADGARREETRRHQLPDLVDDIVYSHEVGLAKPDGAIFALACRRLGVLPEETIFVDDVVGHVESAAGCGLRSVLHVETESTIRAVEALRAADN